MLKCSAVFQRTYSDTDSPVPLVSNVDSPAPKRKSADEIIRSATFPAAHVPPLDDTSPSKSIHWSPCALSLALVALGSEGGRRWSREEEEEEALKRKQLQEEHINKIQSGLGKLIMKEENEKEQIRERSQSAQRYDPQQTNCDGDNSKTSSLPGYGRNGLHRVRSDASHIRYHNYLFTPTLKSNLLINVDGFPL
uniref:Putative adherens-junction anchoring domain-containing protein n=1 Tax=Oncorhynchus kisutch TaxID=8019 RepID=A0A8C7MRU2_ONCKI